MSDSQQFVGECTGERRGALAEVAVKNKFSTGDSLELMTPAGNLHFTLTQMENAKGQPVSVAPGDGHRVWLPLPEAVLLFHLAARRAGSSARHSRRRPPTPGRHR